MGLLNWIRSHSTKTNRKTAHSATKASAVRTKKAKSTARKKKTTSHTTSNNNSRTVTKAYVNRNTNSKSKGSNSSPQHKSSWGAYTSKAKADSMKAKGATQSDVDTANKARDDARKKREANRKKMHEENKKNRTSQSSFVQASAHGISAKDYKTAQDAGKKLTDKATNTVKKQTGKVKSTLNEVKKNTDNSLYTRAGQNGGTKSDTGTAKKKSDNITNKVAEPVKKFVTEDKRDESLKKEKDNGTTFAESRGITKQERRKAEKQGAKADTKYHEEHPFLAGLTDNATPFGGMTDGGSYSRHYTDEMREKIKESKNTKSYMAGALAGNAVQYAMPANAGAKVATKVLPKAVKGGQAIANVAARSGIETAVNTPLNVMQSYKEAKNAGEENFGKNFRKSMAVNTALDLATGGAINGAGSALLSKVEGAKLVRLLEKQKAGKLDDADTKALNDLVNKMNNKETGTAGQYLSAKTVEKNKSASETGIRNYGDNVENAKTGRILKEEEGKELIKLQTKANAGKATSEDLTRLSELKTKMADSEKNIPNINGEAKETVAETASAAKVGADNDIKQFDNIGIKTEHGVENYSVVDVDGDNILIGSNWGKPSKDDFWINKNDIVTHGRLESGEYKPLITAEETPIAETNITHGGVEKVGTTEPVKADVETRVEAETPKAEAETVKPETKAETTQAETKAETPQKTEAELEQIAQARKTAKVKNSDVKELSVDDLKAERASIKERMKFSKKNSNGKMSANNKVRQGRLDEVEAELKDRGVDVSETKTTKKTDTKQANIKSLEERIQDGSLISSGKHTNKASTGGKNRTPMQNDNNKVRDAWTSVRRLFEDSFIAIETSAKKVGGEEGKKLLAQINNVRNAKNMANEWITARRKTFGNDIGGKSLNDIFSSELMNNKEMYNDFQAYLIAKHIPARHERDTDIFFGVTPEEAEKTVERLLKKYAPKDGGENPIETFANDVYDYLNALQDYRVDTGLISAKDRAKFAERYPFYVPTNREGDDVTGFFTEGSKLNNQIRSTKGGESAILDMYQQISSATRRTIESGEENVMLNSYFKSNGVSDECLKGATIQDMEHATINATVNNKTKKAQVSFFVDGKPVSIDVDHQVARGIREWNGQEFETLMRFAKASSLLGKPFKALITDWNLAFGVRNGFRDIQQAMVNTKSLRHFTASMPAAGRAIVSKNNAYRKLYESMGGRYAQLVSFDGAGNMNGLNEGGFVNRAIDLQNKASELPVLKQIEAVNGSIEMMPRMSEFIGTLRKESNVNYNKLRNEVTESLKGTVPDGELANAVEDEIANRIVSMVGKDTVERAMRNANDITLNFSRSGAIGKALNMGFVPYFNPSIQGLSKLARQFTETGMEESWKGILNLGMKIGTVTLAPAIFNEAMLKDNEDYQILNTRDKDNNYFIPLPNSDGKFIKIPKPRENAVLAEPVMYGLRYFFDNAEYAYFDIGKLKSNGSLFDKIPLTDEGKQSFRTALDNIGVVNPLTSNLFSPLIMTARNKTWYGGNIDSAYEMSIDEDAEEANTPKVATEDRYNTTTSAIAIQLGQTGVAKALNLSPKRIDNLMDSYLGMIYDWGIANTSEQVQSQGGIGKRMLSLEGNPFTGQFIKDSVFSNKLGTKAWDKVNDMNEKQKDEYEGTYMYDTYKLEDAITEIDRIKGMTPKERANAKRELQKQQNLLYREAIDGKANTVEPISTAAKYFGSGGANKALELMLPETGSEGETWKDYYAKFKDDTGYKNLSTTEKRNVAQNFLDVYANGVDCTKKYSPAKYHDSPSWEATGVSAAELASKGKMNTEEANRVMVSCGVYEDKTDVYHKYVEYGGSTDRYAVTEKRIESMFGHRFEGLEEKYGFKQYSGIWKNGVKGGAIAMSLATSNTKFKDIAYYISNFNDDDVLTKMNAARGFAKKYGNDTDYIVELAKAADKLGDDNTYIKNEEIIAVCDNMDAENDEERSMAYILLGGSKYKNPYGEIGDYSIDSDTGITSDQEEKSGRGYRRRGRRGGWGHGGGSGGGTGITDWNEWLEKLYNGTLYNEDATTGTSKVTDNTKKSALDNAYRKKVRKLMMNNK